MISSRWDENLEDELRLFVESHNEVSRELNKYVKETDKIIQQATEEIRAKNELLEKLSITDELTHLKNRRAFNNLFEKDCTLAYREKLYINFAMLDIDNFKKINDTFGHVAGDLCLKKLAETMQSLFTRRTDDLFRIGGEEFVVYFLSKERTDFYSILEELRKRVENTELNYQDKVIKFTISIGGVSEIPQDQNCKNIVLKADENLYIAKNEGKNRVILKSYERREEYEKD